MSIYEFNCFNFTLNVYTIVRGNEEIVCNWLRKNPKWLVLKVDQQPEDFFAFWGILMY